MNVGQTRNATGEISVTEPQRVSLLLKEIHQGPAWHGPSLREVLEGVDARLASRRLMPQVHTIWELVLHLTAWMDIFRVRAEGRHLEVSNEKDWPPMPSYTEENWRRTLSALWTAEKNLEEMASSISVSRYEEIIAGDTPTSLYTALNGLISHTAYHAGQIAILKK